MNKFIANALASVGLGGIADQSYYGGLISTAETDINRRGSRELWDTAPGRQGFDELVQDDEREHIVSCSRKLYGNFPPVKGAVDSKATYAIGRAWLPISQSTDKVWARQAEALLRELFYPIADVSGRDLVSQLFLGSVGVDRDGGFGVLLTESKTGFPQVQFVSADRIAGRSASEAKLESGPFRGRKMVNGVIVNKQGRAIGYRIWEDEGKHRDVSERNFIYVSDPCWIDQKLGLPSYFSAIESARASLQASTYEELATMIASSQTLVEYNEQGGPDPTDPRHGLGASPAATNSAGVSFKKMVGGAVNYFRSNSGSKLEMFKSERPGDAWESFQDRLIRMVHTSMSWPTELTWKSSELKSPTVRLKIGQAMREVEDRQDLINPLMRRIAGYAIAKFMQRGDLPFNSEWMKWVFTMPPRLSVDAGRDSKAAREDYDKGFRNLTDILGEQGKALEPHLRERAAEEQLIAAVAAETGVDADRLVSQD